MSKTTSPRLPGEVLTHRQTITVMVGLMLGMFLSSLDQTIVSTSIYTIANDLDGLSLQAWATTAYLITSTVSTPLYGKLSDIFGRRPLYLAAILIFLAGSLYAGSVHSMTELAIARGIQGMGAGGLLALALTIIGDIVALKDRAKFQGYFMSVFGISSVLGPVIGGAFAGSANILGFDGWRWVFFINIPIGLLVLLGSRTLVAGDRSTGRLGALGAVLGTAGMVSLVYGVTRFGEEGFADPIAHALGAAAVVLLFVFVLTQRNSRDPLVPLSLFRDRSRSGAYLTMLGLAIGPMGSFYVITLYMQQVREYSPLLTGLSWLPFAVGIILGAGLAPQLLLKVAPRYVATAGALLSAAGAFWFSSITADTGYWLHLAPAMLIVALGFGLGVIALTQAAVYRVDADRAGIASALLNSAQQIGVALGLAILAGVAAAVTAGPATAALPAAEALTAGYSSALLVGAGILLATALLALLTISKVPSASRDESSKTTAGSSA